MEREFIEVTFEETDIPDLPSSTPINARLSIVGDAIHIVAYRTGSLAGDITYQFDLPKDQIIRVYARILSDVPDDEQYSTWNQPECSDLSIFHKDPFEVVPEFQTRFSSKKSYWIKAVCKMIEEKLQLDIDIKNET
jgi:hypothetical protein